MPVTMEELEDVLGIDDAPACGRETPSMQGDITQRTQVTASYLNKLRRLGDRWKNALATPGANGYDSASECDNAIVWALVKRDFTDDEILRTLEASARYADRIERKGETHTRELFEREIAKARGLVEPFPPDEFTPVDLSEIRSRRAAGEGVDSETGPPDEAPPVPPARGVTLPRFPRTDSGNAELFAALYGTRLRYDHRRGEWLVYRGHWWQVDNDDEVHRLAKEAARQRYVAALHIGDEDERRREATFAISSENRTKLEATLALAQAERPLADTGDGWDEDPWLLATKNGVVDLRTGDLRNGHPEDRISRHSPVAFDSEATCPAFERFIAHVLPDREVRVYVQKLAGIALTGDVSVQILVFLHGAGANGKSVFANAIKHVIGRDYARQAAPGLLLKARGDRHPTEVADLYGARLVVSTEIDDGRELAEALVKQTTGGDELKGRFMHRDFFGFKPTHKTWLLANHRPTVRGTEEAIWRRVKLVPFGVTIAEADRDEHLGEKLAAEEAGILNWMIEGCLSWQRDGALADPAAVRAAVEEYRADSDALAPFFDECCAIESAQSTRASALYRTYKTWAMVIGLSDREILTQKRFGSLVNNDVRFTREKKASGWFYHGIGMKPDWLERIKDD
jgi:putative DNA primase/helicase